LGTSTPTSITVVATSTSSSRALKWAMISRPKEELSEPAQRRLEALVRTSDGFELAEVDLAIRGEGQLLGARQSGFSDFRFTNLRADRALLEQARAAARELAPSLSGTPLEDEL